eukprot:scaffold80721_cov59-Phaeocystis_antarctica.AAC.5
MADLEGCERMQRPLCWAERRRATAMRLSGGGGGLPLLREVARCASVPPGVGEIVHAVLRLCGVAVTGAAERTRTQTAPHAIPHVPTAGPTEWTHVARALSSEQLGSPVYLGLPDEMGTLSVADIPAQRLRAARTLFDGRGGDGACMCTVEYMHSLARCSKAGGVLVAWALAVLEERAFLEAGLYTYICLPDMSAWCVCLMWVYPSSNYYTLIRLQADPEAVAALAEMQRLKRLEARLRSHASRFPTKPGMAPGESPLLYPRRSWAQDMGLALGKRQEWDARPVPF